MDAVFLKLFNMSITASWLILAVIIIRFVFKKAPKWVNCALWALVAVRLVCPFSFESVFSLVPSMETVPENIGYSDLPSINSGISAVNQAINPVISQNFAPDVTESVNPMQVITSVSSVVWIVGVAVLLIYSLVSYIQIRKKVKISMPLSGNVLLCDGISSPFILGIIKPKVYLPSAMPEEQRQYVIAHEKAHLKRRDHWWKPLGFLILTVYWFNPLIWVAYILLCRDIELACDERVIKAMGEESKKSYSEALLSCSIPRKMIAACPVAFGEVGVKDRIKNVLNYKKPAFWVIIAAVVISVIAAVCFMTNPSNTDIGGKVYEASKYYHSSVVDGRKLVEQNIRYSISDDLMMAKISGSYVDEIGGLALLEETENELVDMVVYELPLYHRIIGFNKVYMHELTLDAEQGVMTYVLLLMRNGDIICGRLPRGEYVMDVFRLTEKNDVEGFGQNVFTVTESGEQSVKEVTYGELVAESSGDKDALLTSQIKLRRLNEEYGRYSMTVGLPTQRERAQIAGFGAAEATDTRTAASRYYKEWSKSIGVNDSVKTLEDYYEMKYNRPEEYKLLKGYVRAVEKQDIDTLTGFEQYLKSANEISEKIVGQTTSEGIVIESFTTHFVDRTIGQCADPHKGMRQGTPVDYSLDALLNPVDISDIQYMPDGDIRKTYYGKNADVTISVLDKKLIQANPA